MSKTTDNMTWEGQRAAMADLGIPLEANGSMAARLLETADTGRFLRMGVHDVHYGTSRWSVDPKGVFGELQEKLGAPTPTLHNNFNLASAPDTTPASLISGPAQRKPDFVS